MFPKTDRVIEGAINLVHDDWSMFMLSIEVHLLGVLFWVWNKKTLFGQGGSDRVMYSTQSLALVPLIQFRPATVSV